MTEESGSTPHERGMLSEFITHGATEYRTGYETSWKRWMEYRAGLDESVRPNPFLGGLSVQDQAVRLGCYVVHLHDILGLRGDSLERHLSNLKMVFLEALVDVSAFTTSLVRRARRAAQPTSEEAAELEAGRRTKQSLPTSLDMIWSIRDEYWSGETWLCPGLDRRCVWVAIALGFDCGARVSNLARCDLRRKDHTIKAHDLTVIYSAGTPPELCRARGGETFRRVAADLDVPSCVVRVEYHFVTGKRNMPADWHTLGRRSFEESTLLDDLVTLLIHSRVRGTDPLFTRYPGPEDQKGFSRKILTSRQITEGLNWAALNAGLPLGSLKTSGVRRGCAETARATGASQDELCHGRWASSSTVPYRHYLSQAGERDSTGREASKGSMARGRTDEGLAFSLSDVKAIAVSRGLLDCCGEDSSSRVGGQQS